MHREVHRSYPRQQPSLCFASVGGTVSSIIVLLGVVISSVIKSRKRWTMKSSVLVVTRSSEELSVQLATETQRRRIPS